ncbi:TetR/AcrR family transcriptional regulator [Lactobacillaceae bacterium 24-114]
MKRAEQLEKTRQSIMKTATKLFLQKGFGETSTRDIAKQVGITQPALYHHFSDKEVLYLDVMTNLSGKVRKDIQRVMRKHSLEPEEQLWQITQALLKSHPVSIYDQYRLAIGMLSKSSQQKLNMILAMNYLQPIAEYFKQPEVKLRPDILPQEAAELFLASLAPLFGTYQPIGGHNIDEKQRSRLILDCIVHGLAKEN